MHRLAVLTMLAACSSPARTPATVAAPPTRYTLQPIQLFGPEGRHSASHSTSHVTGTLEVRGTRATLALTTRIDVSFVHCPPEMRDGRVSTMQACADESQQPFSRTTTMALAGDARWFDGKLVMGLHGDQQHATLTCERDMFGLTCRFDDQGVFSPHDRDRPTQLRFATPGAKQFALETVTFTEGPTLTGSLAIDATTAIVTLDDGKKQVELRGAVRWAPAGLVISVGPNVGHVQMTCTVDQAGLACDAAVDPEVFNRPSFSGPVTFVAKS